MKQNRVLDTHEAKSSRRQWEHTFESDRIKINFNYMTTK